MFCESVVGCIRLNCLIQQLIAWANRDDSPRFPGCQWLVISAFAHVAPSGCSKHVSRFAISCHDVTCLLTPCPSYQVFIIMMKHRFIKWYWFDCLCQIYTYLFVGSCSFETSGISLMTVDGSLWTQASPSGPMLCAPFWPHPEWNEKPDLHSGEKCVVAVWQVTYIYDCLVFGRHGWTVVISWWLMNKEKLMPILAQGIEPK